MILAIPKREVGSKIDYPVQRLTLTFQIKEFFGLLTFHIKESEWKLRSPKFKTSTFMHMHMCI